MEDELLLPLLKNPQLAQEWTTLSCKRLGRGRVFGADLLGAELKVEDVECVGQSSCRDLSRRATVVSCF